MCHNRRVGVIRKAIVPMAGLGTRLYPVSIVLPKGLMPFVLRDGRITTGLQLIATALIEAGVEQIGVVVSPDQEPVYRRFLEGDTAHYGDAIARKPDLQAAFEALRRLQRCIALIVQSEPYGFGHAVWCARAFAQDEPVLVMLGDHIPLRTGARSPIEQALSLFESLRAPLYAVYRVPLQVVERYGILRGEPTGQPRLYRLQQVVEKPTREYAQQALCTPNLPEGQFFTHFGIYCFPAELWQVQAEIADEYRPGRGEWYLVDAQQRLLARMPAYLLEVEGQMLDFGTPDEYAHAFRTLLNSELRVSDQEHTA